MTIKEVNEEKFLHLWISQINLCLFSLNVAFDPKCVMQ